MPQTDATFLPLPPERTSYTYSKEGGVVSTTLDGGKSRSRVDIIGFTSRVTCQWILTRLEFDFFMSFYVAVAKKGAATFQMDLILDRPDLLEHDCIFVPDTLNVSEPTSQTFFVTAELEVSPLAEPTTEDTLTKRRAANLPGPGYFNRYYFFDSGDDVTHPVIELPSDYSVSFWMHTASDTQYALIGSFDQTTAADHRGVLRYTGTEWLMRHDGYVAGMTATEPVLSFDTWHHIACVRDGTRIKLYIDGTEVEDDSDVNIESLHLRCFGRAYSTAHSYRFLGRMKDYRIYKDRALTSNEITFLNSLGVSGTDPGTNNLEAYFRMDEGTGTTAYDSSGNGKSGVITAADINTFHGSE